jgi:DNA repair protein RecN (Recombination protein N)
VDGGGTPPDLHIPVSRTASLPSAVRARDYRGQVLEEIRITNLGVIDEAVIELGPGLNAVSGETGAGKTMIVSGLGLLLGMRADAARVRRGSTRAAVEGVLRLDADSPLRSRLAELDAEIDDDGTLLVSRTVGSDGRSRAFVGGRSVPVGVLAELMSQVVAVHGQAEQLRLRQPATHRALLDQYSGAAVARPLALYRAAYDRHHAVVAELHEVTTHTQERAREADALRFGLEEIEAAAPQPGEDAALAAEIARLTHVDALQTAIATASDSLVSSFDRDETFDAQTLLARARAVLDGVADHDAAVSELVSRVREIQVLVAELGSDLTAYVSALDADPARLAAAMDRQATLSRLVRKYAAADTGVDGMLSWAEQASRRLVGLDDDDERVGKLATEREQLESTMRELASAISAARRSAAKKLERAVAKELDELAMAGARIVVAVRGTQLGRDGGDDVELQLVAHAGAPALPVQKAASGGELSRIMLALEVVLAGRDPVPTFVFDEVDGGVGGRAAAEVGRRLAQLARSAQVIVVTHLPQVAAFADRHLVVEKGVATRGTVVTSDVIALADNARVVELSRMLAGQSDSEHARGHAEELLAAAAADRAGSPS